MDVTLNLVESWEDAQSFMAWLGERRQVLACDTETGGLEWWHQDLRLVQFGDLQTGWAIPWHLWGGVAKEALDRYRGPLAFHNAKFDIKFLEQHGAPVGRSRVHDTRSMAHLLNPGEQTGLKPLGVKYVDAGADRGQTDLKEGMAKNGWTWATVPVDFPPYWVYSALDPVLTAHLYQQFRPRIVGPLNDVYELEVACLLVLNDVEKRGVRVDLEYCADKMEAVSAAREEIREWVQTNYGFGAGQNKQIAAQLQRDGVLLTKRTAGGEWSVTEKVLAGVDHPLAEAVLNVRKASKTVSYFGNYLKYADSDILHPDINPLGARTGRMSVGRPALQQIPRTKLLRDPFIPREGNKILSVDFDQIEARLLTHMAHDDGLIAAFGEGGDFFTNMARRIYGDDSIEKADPRRQITKSSVYAKLYGAGPATFAATARIGELEAVEFLAKMDGAYPGIKRFQDEVMAEAQQRLNAEGLAYVTTPMGRRQVAEYSDKLYPLVNYKIQGAAADIFKKTLVDLDRAGLAERLVLPVHDEAVFDVPQEDVGAYGEAVVQVFEADKSWLVPLTAGCDVVERWGDKYA